MPTSAIYVLSGANRGNDLSGNGHDLSEAQAVLHAAGPGTSGLASRGGRLVGDGADFRSAGAFTISALVNLDRSSGDRWFAACEKTGANGKTWWKLGATPNGGLYYGYDYGTSDHQDIALAEGILPVSGWALVELVREADGRTLHWRIGGQEVASAVANAAPVGGSAADLILMNDAYNLQQHRMAQVFLNFA